jgi:uncharacterized RDD family membrane protein YckC
VNYAGFWRRFAAHMIDGLLLAAAGAILLIPFVGVAALTSAIEDLDESPEAVIALIFSGLGTVAIAAAATWFYYSWFESSKWQATPGKMAMGIFVTGENGERISLARSSGRYFGKILSGLVLNLGYIMAAFTQRKQALHDMLASTLVLRRRN